MSSALQKAIRSTLVADARVTDLVPVANIFDRLGRPERFPCIILGEGTETADDVTLDRNHIRAFAVLHVWTREGSLAAAQRIATAIRQALKHGTPPLEWGICIDLRFESARFVRDPDGETSHAIVTFESLIEEAL